jgi:transglutaminase-like putative cysteine protease
MPRADSPLLDRNSRAWTLAAGAACLLPLLLQLPGRIALGIALAALSTGALSWRRPVPTPLRLLLALTVIGATLAATGFRVGRETACALLAAMLAIKPSETWRVRDARSLLGFGLFAPFATFLLDQGPVSLLLALAGVSLALTALQRLTELESGELRPLPPWQRLLAVWRLAAIGLPLALAAFWLFPRLAAPLWGVPERALARTGLSDRMSPGDWIDLMADDTVALRADFFGPMPAPEQMYWRGPVLWNFDGRTWTQPQWLRGVPAAPVRSTGTRWDYQIELEPTDRRQLVALDLPATTPEGVLRSLDYGLYSQRPLSALTRWRMQSSPPAQFEPRLARTLRWIALDLPPGYNPRTMALARQWRAEVDADQRIPAAEKDAAIVQRALQMVRADFAYTLDTPLLGRHSVDEFLFDVKAGYCEHFSSSFVVLMRAAGIPARVVTGYAGGYRNPIGGYWLVLRSDAHAWAEAWLPTRGWVRVDPTAAVAPERIYDTIEDRAPAFGGLQAMRPVWNASDWLRRGWNDFVLGFDAARQRTLLQPLGVDDLDQSRLAQLFSVAAVLALGIMLWLAARQAREHDPLLRAWHRLGQRYARLGLGRAPHEPAGDWARRVLAERPQAVDLAALSARFSDWRYAGDQDTRSDARARVHQLVRDLRTHRP